MNVHSEQSAGKSRALSLALKVAEGIENFPLGSAAPATTRICKRPAFMGSGYCQAISCGSKANWRTRPFGANRGTEFIASTLPTHTTSRLTLWALSTICGRQRKVLTMKVG